MKVTIKLKQGRCVTIKIMRVIIRTPECGRFQYSYLHTERDFVRTAARAQPRDIGLTAAFDRASISSAIYSGS